MNNRLFIALIFFLSATTTVAMADDTLTKFKCGNTSVILYNSSVVESPFFVLTVEISGVANFYAFPVTNEFLEIRCEKNKKGKDFLLLNHICGGSKCSESNYSLIDLSTNKQVLNASEPYHGNSDKAASILGKPIIPFSCKIFSKGSSTPNDKGEYCIVSPIELY
ncbi:MAG: hypothetical protein ACLPSL_08290 [Smithella sp.]